MTFTLVNECYDPKVASQKTSYLMLAFAITPGLSIALGGILNTYYGWTSCFYASAIYGILLLLLVTRLPETQTTLDLQALNYQHLVEGYRNQFKNSRLIVGGLLMGSSTCFVYVFAALAPFIVINIFGLDSAEYGLANLLPSIGLVLGSLVGANLVKKYSLQVMMKTGIYIAMLGTVVMLLALLAELPVILSLFTPMIIIYFGLCFIMANASSLAMSHTTDKAHGSAVMNFINMGLTTMVVLSLGFFPIQTMLLPMIFLALGVLMLMLFSKLTIAKA